MITKFELTMLIFEKLNIKKHTTYPTISKKIKMKYLLLIIYIIFILTYSYKNYIFAYASKLEHIDFQNKFLKIESYDPQTPRENRLHEKLVNDELQINENSIQDKQNDLKINPFSDPISGPISDPFSDQSNSNMITKETTNELLNTQVSSSDLQDDCYIMNKAITCPKGKPEKYYKLRYEYSSQVVSSCKDGEAAYAYDGNGNDIRVSKLFFII